MSAPLTTMMPQDSLWQINQQMQALGVRRLVITHYTGRLAGLVTQTQMTKTLDPAEMYHVMEQMQAIIDRQTKELQHLNQQLQASNTELSHLATVDALTQVVNRRKFDEFVTSEWQRLLLLRQPLSLIMCDVDHFKDYNDTYGHLAGDACLKKIAQAMRSVTRQSYDLVARYGGEEFAVVLPNTDSAGAEQVAQTLLLTVQCLNIPFVSPDRGSYVTVSLGVATVIPDINLTLDDLIDLADQLLYQAKHQGRNTFAIDSLNKSA